MTSPIISNLKEYINPEKKIFFPRFFKTGKGEYGEGDLFWGITVPNMREVAKRYYKDISLDDVRELTKDPIHEVRMVGYLILTYKFEKGNDEEKGKIYSFYLSNLEGVNNWDIVDLSCYKIVGEYLVKYPEKRDILYELAKSNDLWRQRISIVSTMAFIRRNDFKDTLKISELLLDHKHDLIHKAVGWMLREVGKRDIDILREFLNKNVKHMSRTTLRYSIERMDEEERKKYLSF